MGDRSDDPTASDSTHSIKGGHDRAYHALFNHPALVRSLIRDYIPTELWRVYDLEPIEQVSAKFITYGLLKREGDLIYKLPRRNGQALYMYLMLEFQSSSDRWMANRMMVYTGLLYQHLIEQDELGAGDLLPLVLPVVLYNGSAAWTAPRRLRDLLHIEAPTIDPLVNYQPTMRYLLLDIHRTSLQNDHNSLAASLFALEQAQTVEQFLDELERLVALLTDDAHTKLAKAFTAWLRKVRLPNAGVTLPDDRVYALQEVRNMLRESIERKVAEGIEQGIEQGIQRGIEQGAKQKQYEIASLFCQQRLERTLTAA
ncbi:MAG: Rpn family recombination-promoting nuclease/putative transposase, partial [Myxococcota bacterium]